MLGNNFLPAILRNASRTLVCVVILLMSLSRDVGAQTSPGSRPDPRKDAKVRFGPLFLTLTISLDQLGMDSNVFNSVTDAKSDFTMTISPRLQAWLPVARKGLISASTKADVVYFKTYASERSIDPTVELRGDAYLHRLGIFAETSLSHSRQRPNLEIDARSRRDDTKSRLGVSYQVRPKLLLELGGYSRHFSFDQNKTFFGVNLRESLNRNERGVNVKLHHALTVKTSIFVSGETQRARFEFSKFKDSEGFRAMVGFEFSPRALIAGKAAVGVRRFSPLNASLEDFSGLSSNVELSSTILNATRLSLRMDRDVAYSLEVSQPYYVTNGIGGSVRRQLFRNADVIIGLDRHVNVYRTLLPIVVMGTIQRRDVNRIFNADIGYRVSRSSRFGFTVSRSRRSSNTAIVRDYNGLRAGVSFTYEPQ